MIKFLTCEAGMENLKKIVAMLFGNGGLRGLMAIGLYVRNGG